MPKSRAKFIWIIVLIAIILIFVIAVGSNNNTSNSNSGIIERAVATPQCELTYYSCVHDCGDGALSSICREKCTWQRDSCKGK